MFRITFSVIIATFAISCTKTETRHFHGRVYYCDNTPKANTSITIYREFDTGMEYAEAVGGCITDANGYYSFIAEVKLKGSLKYYKIDIGHFGCINNHEQQDIEINCELSFKKNYLFHIKNIQPFNNNDTFDSLLIIPGSDTSFFQFVCGNLNGQNIDTIINISTNNLWRIKTSFTKNGIRTANIDTLDIPNCKDTLITNIFY
jgi:hypothetical protein